MGNPFHCLSHQHASGCAAQEYFLINVSQRESDTTATRAKGHRRVNREVRLAPRIKECVVDLRKTPLWQNRDATRQTGSMAFVLTVEQVYCTSVVGPTLQMPAAVAKKKTLETPAAGARGRSNTGNTGADWARGRSNTVTADASAARTGGR